MKPFFILLTLTTGLFAQEITPEKKAEVEEKHTKGATQLAEDQDELAADVIDMIEQQTATNIIELLSEVENIMGENIEQLDQLKTGGATIATQTEIIEKIFEAAEKKQENSQKEQENQKPKEGEGEEKPKEGEGEGEEKGQGEGKGKKSNSGMLEMMRRMMDEDQKGEGKGKKPGKPEKPGDQSGEGQTGGSDTKNEQTEGPVEGKTEPRTVPRSSGTTPEALPREFHKALDAYNRALRSTPSNR